MSIRDVGLRQSVTPRAKDISERITAAIAAGGTPERMAELHDYQRAIDMTMAWQADMGADEHKAWLEILGG